MRDALFFSKLRVLLCGWRWKHHRRASWLKARLRHLRHRMQRASRTITRTPTPTRSSPFLLEPLEPRLLLAADLTGVIQSAAFIDPAVPTNTASAVVQVQNIGDQRVTQSQVGVYASLDTTLDSSDILLGTANTDRVNAGASKNVTVNLTLPSTLNPVPYTLLAKFDNANAITENSETNNVAVGGTINGTWKFGTVSGRAGNTTLTLRDADGTIVTYSLSGPGTGEVIKDGSTWDVKITGTTASSAVTIATNNGGNNLVTLNDIHVFGPLASFTAATTDLTGTLAIDGPVNIPGIQPGTITLGSIQGGIVAVPSVEWLTILGSTTNATIYVGTTFGQDGQPGGSGANADIYGQGSIGLFTVTGAMTGTTVRVGINPVDGVYGNDNDQLVGGTTSSINVIVIGGALSADTRFYAGRLPSQYFLGGSLRPTAGDGHFISGLSLNAALQQDTGRFNVDQRTNNPAVTGSVTDPQGIQTFVAGFGTTATFNILSDRQANGSFTLSRERLEQINGAQLTDGFYILQLEATNTAGNSTQINVPFTLDTQVPVLTFVLAAASDTAPVGDQQTTNASVTLLGQTEANAFVELVGLGLTTTADGTGAFSFTNVALVPGANTFTVLATDVAGNQRSEARTIIRVVVGNSAPVLATIGNQTIDEGQLLTFTATAVDSDVPAQVLTFSLAGTVPAGASMTPGGVFTWMPTEAQGPNSYTFDVVVSDGMATDFETITVTVSEVNVAPVANDQSVTTLEDTAKLITMTGSDVDNDSLIFSIVTGPTHGTLSWSGANRTYTPTANYNGPDSFTFKVNDGQLDSSSASVNILVTPVNDAPVLVAIGDQTVTDGQLVTFMATANDPDVGQTRTFSLENGVGGTVPTWASIEPTTGLVSILPPVYAGPVTVTFDVVVTDNGTPALSDRETIRVTVQEPDAVFFQGLGNGPGGLFLSLPFGVSGNGEVVIGMASGGATGLETVRWTVGGGIEDLSQVVGVPVRARAVSSDGNVLVGMTMGGDAFRWSQLDGLQIIMEGSIAFAANGVSLDGSIVVGGGQNIFSQDTSAFIWTQPTGAILLNPLPGYTSSVATAYAVSADGSVIIGENLGDGELLAVRWVADGFGGFMVEALGDLPGGIVRSDAMAVSADGAVIVGLSESDLGMEVFRWTASGGMQGLGFTGSYVSVSADGSTVLAGGDIWDENNGVRSLESVMSQLGVSDLAGWSYLDSMAMTGDGRTIVGVGTNPLGDFEAWRAVLPENLFAPQYAGHTSFSGQADNPLTFTLNLFAPDVSDLDSATQQFQVRLIGNVPAGATLEPSGFFFWTPTTSDIGVHQLRVRLYDDGVPNLFSEFLIDVTVTA